MKPLSELQQTYNLEINKVIKQIKNQKPNSVLLQFPDGLKPYATQIADYIEEKINSSTNSNKKTNHKTNTKIKIKIWLGSCFGACDIPNTSSDLVIQFGHASWN